MTSVLESVIGPERFAAMQRGEPVEISGNESAVFQCRMALAKQPELEALRAEVQWWREQFPLLTPPKFC